MKKIELSFDNKFGLIQDYLKNKMSEGEFEFLCQNVEGFQEQYIGQKEVFEKVQESLEFEYKKEYKAFPLLIEIDKKFTTFIAKIKEAVNSINNISSLPQLEVANAMSSDTDSRIIKEINAKTIDDITNTIKDLVKHLYTLDNVNIRLKIEFFDCDKFISVFFNDSDDEIKNKVKLVFENNEFEEINTISVYIIES